MDALAWIKSRRRELLLAGGACGLVALGAAGGAWLHPRTIRVTEYKDRVQTVEHTVTVEKPVVQYRDRVITRVVTRPDGTRTETHVEEESGKRTGGSETTTDRNTTAERSVAERLVVAPEGRWSVRVLAGADTRGSVVAGAAADYRLLGPLTLGAWALAPVAGAPGGFTVGLSAGLRF